MFLNETVQVSVKNGEVIACLPDEYKIPFGAYRSNVIVVQQTCIPLVSIAEGDKGVTIKAVQTVRRAQPDEALVVLTYAADVIVGQTALHVYHSGLDMKGMNTSHAGKEYCDG